MQIAKIERDVDKLLERSLDMQRHEQGDAIVIPIILRPCDWHPAPFGKLRATPTDGKPVTQWPDRDLAMLDVAKDIRRAAEKIRTSAPLPTVRTTQVASDRATMGPRSSNLGLTCPSSDVLAQIGLCD